MKTLFLGTILLLGFGTFDLKAQDIRLTSGEHAYFSRIVIFFDNIQDWQFGRSPDGYTLIYSDAATGFEMGEVYQFIPRTRVSGVSHDASTRRINFTLACECHADAFALRGGNLALDFKDGPPPPNSRFEALITGESMEGAVREAPAPRPTSALVETSGEKPQRPQTNATRLTLSVSGPNPFEEALSQQLTEEEALPVRAPDQIQLRNSMLRGLSDALSAGLVDPVDASPFQAIGTPLSPPQNRNTIEDHMDLTNQLLRDVERFATSPPPTTCPEGPDFAGFDPETLVKRVADLRRESVDGQFRDVPEVMEDLAEHYLFMGFGAEARSSIKLAPDSKHADVILGIAAVLDEDPLPPILEDLASCQNSLSLWYVLAFPDGREIAEKTRETALRTFSSLPSHLRAQLGTRLAQTFALSGDRAAVALVENALNRGAETQSSTRFQQATLLIGEGLWLQAEILLEDLTHSNSEEGVSATRLLASERLARGSHWPEGFSDSLASLAYQYRGRAIGDEFRELALGGLLAEGKVKTAFEEWQSPTLGDAPLSDGLWENMVDGLLDGVSDVEFVRLAILHEADFSGARTNVEQKIKISDRLRQIGLPNLSASLAAGLASDDPERTRLFAEAWQAQGEPTRALESLLLSAMSFESELVNAAIETGQLEVLKDPTSTTLPDDVADRLAFHSSATEWESAGTNLGHAASLHTSLARGRNQTEQILLQALPDETNKVGLQSASDFLLEIQTRRENVERILNLVPEL